MTRSGFFFFSYFGLAFVQIVLGLNALPDDEAPTPQSAAFKSLKSWNIGPLIYLGGPIIVIATEFIPPLRGDARIFLASTCGL